MSYIKKSVYLDNATKDAVAEIQTQRPLPTLSGLVRELVNDHIRPMKGSDRARQFLRDAGGDFTLAHKLLLEYLHGKYRNFNSHQQPGKREYDKIRRTLHYIQTGKA